MKASDVSLILTTTEGYFTKEEVPLLYVEIQEHRAQLERALSRQVSFTDALYSWMENIWQPIMQEIGDNLRLRLAASEKGISEVYFEIYDLAKENDFKTVHGAAQEYVQKNVALLTALLHLFMHRKEEKHQYKEAI